MRSLIDFFFPPRCLICHGTDHLDESPSLCRTCIRSFPFISPPHCSLCGLPFTSEEGISHPCSSCLNNPFAFHSCRAVGLYDNRLREAILSFKFRDHLQLARPLGRLMACNTYDSFSWEEIDLLVPVPLHTQRLRSRGFNQSLLLVREIHRTHPIPLDFSNLQRKRSTLPQTTLDVSQRRQNVKDAFSVSSNNPFCGKTLLLIDDVFTSGATLNEAARTLLVKGKAEKVHCLVLARTV